MESKITAKEKISKNASTGIWKYRRIMILLTVALAALALFCLCVGKFSVTPYEALRIIFGRLTGVVRDWEPMAENDVLGLRLTRVIADVGAGAA